MDDDEIEQTMRDALRHRSDDVEVGAGYAETAQRGARSHRRAKVVAAGVLASAVIVPVAVITQQGLPGETGDSVADGPTTRASPKASAEPIPAGWRVESYRGVQLRVPPSWGWGGAPSPEPRPEGSEAGNDDLHMCGRGAFAYPGGDGVTRFEEEVDMPYVGRAGYYMTDVCMGGWSSTPQHPWVWFGTPIDVGIVELSNGFVQQTVEVGGVRVTVGDDDPAEMATILGSIEAVDLDANGCDAQVRTASQLQPQELPSDPLQDLGRVESVSVCAYRFIDDEAVRLGYSTRVEGQRARHIVDEIAMSNFVVTGCIGRPSPSLDAVIMRVVTADAAFDVLTRLDGCEVGYDAGFGIGGLSRANVEPWVVDAVGLYVSGGQVGNALSGLFRPIPG